MLLHRESGVHTRRIHVRNEPETSRSSRYRILHDDRVRHGTKLLEVPLERLIGSLERETANEDFATRNKARDAGRATVRQDRRKLAHIADAQQWILKGSNMEREGMPTLSPRGLRSYKRRTHFLLPADERG